MLLVHNNILKDRNVQMQASAGHPEFSGASWQLLQGAPGFPGLPSSFCRAAQ